MTCVDEDKAKLLASVLIVRPALRTNEAIQDA